MSDSICILPRLEGVGGPASFRARLSAGLERRGIRAHSNPAEPGCRAVLVIAGTRRLNDLLQARQRGVRIVQRLDGMNWLHPCCWPSSAAGWPTGSSTSPYSPATGGKRCAVGYARRAR